MSKYSIRMSFNDQKKLKQTSILDFLMKPKIDESNIVVNTSTAKLMTKSSPNPLRTPISLCHQSMPLPTFKRGLQQKVLFELPLNKASGAPPNPYPKTYRDHWDARHVKMPCSSRNISNWTKIKRALDNDIKDTNGLINAIKQCCPDFRGDLDVLRHTLNNLPQVTKQIFFSNTLPEMIKLALALPEVVTEAVPMLNAKKNFILFLTQKQIACLLANAFFCTFPGRSDRTNNFQRFNFVEIFTSGRRNYQRATKMEKIKCLLCYFRSVTKKMPTGVVSFERRFVTEERLPKWNKSETDVTGIKVKISGDIESDGKGLLQMDFANEYIGGGTIGAGCVQEEIRFLICPELIASCLFCEKMNDTEAIIITGCQQFSSYTGYSNTFKFNCPFEDNTRYDARLRRSTRIVAIDALYFSQNSLSEQCQEMNFERELNKAYVGFMPGSTGGTSGIATGNWGCGAFNGDPMLKAIIQIMAASQAKRELVYFTFGLKVISGLDKFHKELKKQEFRVCDLYETVMAYQKSNSRDSLFNFILDYYH